MPADNPQEKDPVENLIRNILIIDRDEPARNQLSGILAELRGKDSGINDASVDTIDAAQDYMNKEKPYLIIIDPDIAPVEEVLPFIKRNRKKFPIWVLNSIHASWWNEHKDDLQNDPFGRRLETYYHMTKNRRADQTKSLLLATLALCQFDFLLMLLEETAEDITSDEVATVAKSQVRKMVEKVNKSVLAPLVRELGSSGLPPPNQENTAFVSMSFDPGQIRRYESIIEPMLQAGGFTPIMMGNEFPDDSITKEILNVIGTCSLFIGDITKLRADVLIEVGAALITKVPKVLIARGKKLPAEKLPFMLKNQRIVFYTSDSDLSSQLRAALAGIRQRTNANRRAI